MPSVNVKPMPPHKLGDAYDAGAKPPRTRTKYDEDGYPAINKRGEEVLERIDEHRAPSMKWISWSGDVIFDRVTWGSSQKHNHNSMQERIDKMHSRKAIVYHECPVRNSMSRVWLPAEMRELEPCRSEDFGRGKKYGFHCGCPHIEQLIAYRKAKHKEREDLHAKKFRLAAEKEQLTEQRHNELMAALAAQARNRGK